MIVGVGIDLTETERIAAALQRFGARFEERVFTQEERTYCRSKSNPVPHYAARFAAKEAFFKAVGLGWSRGMCWTDVAVLRAWGASPCLELRGAAHERLLALGADEVHVTLTHTPTTAAAVVILERRSGG